MYPFQIVNMNKIDFNGNKCCQENEKINNFTKNSPLCEQNINAP